MGDGRQTRQGARGRDIEFREAEIRVRARAVVVPPRPATLAVSRVEPAKTKRVITRNKESDTGVTARQRQSGVRAASVPRRSSL